MFLLGMMLFRPDLAHCCPVSVHYANWWLAELVTEVAVMYGWYAFKLVRIWTDR